MKIVYNRFSGEIYSAIAREQNPSIMYKNYPRKFRDKLAIMNIEKGAIPADFRNYRVKNNTLSRQSEQEICELQEYRRILSQEERQLNNLKPPPEEIQKAQNTIEILTLIQEVM